LLRKEEIGNREKVTGSRGRSPENRSLFPISDPEWDIIKILGDYQSAVAEAAARMDPSVLAAYLYELCTAFSRFYHDCPILNAGTPELVEARLALSRAVLRVLRDGLHLICIPFLETM
jgi:arginyl-tRNA synthetase